MLCRRLANAARYFLFCAVVVPLLADPAYAAPFAYITNQNSNNVSVIDTATHAVVTTVAVGANPYGVAVNRGGARAYVVNGNSGNVSVIDTTTNTVIATVMVGANPGGIAVSPDGTRAYVANFGSNYVSVIDTATNTVIDTVLVGIGPVGVAVNPANARAYVANRGGNNVSVIDIASNTVVATIAVENGPVAFGIFIGGPVALDYTGAWFNANESGWGLSVIRGSSGLYGIIMYHYNQSNNPVWYFMAGGSFNGAVYSAPVMRYSGPYFGSAFNSVQVSSVAAGNASINFTSATSATLTYTIDGVAVTKNISATH